MNRITRNLLAILIFFVSGTAIAQTNPTPLQTSQTEDQMEGSDSIRFSLLTCSPGEEIYEVFGHTAIRYENMADGTDIVFNYGLFSFDTPNFILRFVKGETDYRLGIVEYPNFAAEYRYFNRSVTQQTLNLTEQEKQNLLSVLMNNYRPENRIYRYNFFYDNCSTRPRDRIEDAVNGQVVYVETGRTQSYRDIVYECTTGYPWYRFGMSMLLGSGADKPITHRQEMFAPFYLMDAFDKAVITSPSGAEKPLVTDTRIIVDKAENIPPTPFPFTPMRTFLLMFILIAGVTIYGIRRKRPLWGIDLVLFAAAGLAGCIIAFLSFFSEHPTVDSNYLMIVFHPLHLIFLPFFLRKEATGRRSWYHLVNFIILTLFIVLWPLIPQKFDPAVLPLALSLLVRSGSNLLLTFRKRK